jgi:hypothetical protein
MQDKKEEYQEGRQGSGSAENKGEPRSDQQLNDQPGSQKQQISEAIGEDARRVSTIGELGGRSGRDDQSGGSGDAMEDQNTGQATEKF